MYRIYVELMDITDVLNPNVMEDRQNLQRKDVWRVM